MFFHFTDNPNDEHPELEYLNCQQYYTRWSQYQASIVSFNFRLAIVGVVLLILLIIAVLLISKIGYAQVKKSSIRCLSCHWCLKRVINLREGQNPATRIDRAIKNLLENDEELVNAIVNEDDI